MKNKSHKLQITTLIIISLLVILFPPISVQAKAISHEKLYEISIKANELNIDLINNFEKLYKNKSEYSGSFLDETGTYHFQYKSPLKNTEIEKNLLSFNKSGISIIFENVKYSDIEINLAKNAIEKSSYYKNGAILEVYIDYSINGIVVVYDETFESLNKMVHSLSIDTKDFKNIKYEPREKRLLQEEVSISGGSPINYSSNACSAGFYAKRNGAVGFVTAGHCATSVGNKFYHNGALIGTVKARIYQSNCDALFVEKTSSTTIIKKGLGIAPFASTPYTSAATVLPLQGSTMKFYGRYHTYTTTILSNNSSTGSWSNMLKYNKNTSPGDSGGIIIIGNYAYGVHRGGDSANTPSLVYYAYATPSKTVLSILGLTN